MSCKVWRIKLGTCGCYLKSCCVLVCHSLTLWQICVMCQFGTLMFIMRVNHKSWPLHLSQQWRVCHWESDSLVFDAVFIRVPEEKPKWTVGDHSACAKCFSEAMIRVILEREYTRPCKLLCKSRLEFMAILSMHRVTPLDREASVNVWKVVPCIDFCISV